MEQVIKDELRSIRDRLDALLLKADGALPELEAGREVAWGQKFDDKFKASLLWIEAQLNLPADFLASCIAFETGGTFSPSIKNAAGSSGLGLIQFMSFTYTAMVKAFPKLADKTPNHAALAQLSAVEQLSWVYFYFLQFRKDFSGYTLEDVYMTILFPKAVGKPLDWEMPWKYGELAYKQNAGLDANKDRKITKEEASAGVRRMYTLGMQQKA